MDDYSMHEDECDMIFGRSDVRGPSPKHLSHAPVRVQCLGVVWSREVMYKVI